MKRIFVYLSFLVLSSTAFAYEAQSLMSLGNPLDFTAPVVYSRSLLTQAGAGQIVYDSASNSFYGLPSGADPGQANSWVNFGGTAASLSEVVVGNGNGVGSTTNNTVRRWTNTLVNVGTDITYNDSAANGGTFTINAPGVYSVTFTDAYSGASAGNFGITVNSSALTTGYSSISYAQGVRSGCYSVNSGNPCSASWTGYFAQGDIIREQVSGLTNLDASDYILFHIVRIK